MSVRDVIAQAIWDKRKVRLTPFEHADDVLAALGEAGYVIGRFATDDESEAVRSGFGEDAGLVLVRVEGTR